MLMKLATAEGIEFLSINYFKVRHLDAELSASARMRHNIA